MAQQTVTFESGRGPIEVTWEHGGFQPIKDGVAYFKADDILADIGVDGSFTHPAYGTQYKFSPPIPHSKTLNAATLQVLEWRTVGRVEM